MKRRFIEDLCYSMGASVDCHFHAEDPPDILIIDEVGSQKYHIARSIGTPIYHSSLIPELANISVSSSIEDNFVLQGNEHAVEKFKVHPLTGLQVSCTGFAAAERVKVYKLIEELGGNVCRNLKQNTTTHLIIAEDKIANQGQDKTSKLTAATLWGCDVTSKKWLEHLKEKNIYVAEKHRVRKKPHSDFQGCSLAKKVL